MPSRTLSDLELEGFTHIEATCDGCGKIAHIPFQLLRQRHRVRNSDRAADVAASLICRRCDLRPGSWRPWRQEMASGYATGPAGHRGHR